MIPHVGGSFAPPLTDEKLTEYGELIAALPTSPLKDAMTVLHKCCAEWWEQPLSSSAPGTPHPSGKGTIVLLDQPIKDKLFDAIPWKEELAMHGQLFDAIDNGTHKQLRDAAFHLLWHAKELELDREPCTSDML